MKLKTELPVIFMGTTELSLKILQAIYLENFPIVGVYTRAPKPAGRGHKLQQTVVHQFAENHGLPLFTPKTLRDPEEQEKLRQLGAAVVIVAAYGLIIPENVLNIPQYGCINVHASLLPRWRGASPIQAALLHGDEYSGVTIMQMDPGIDTGDIIDMQPIPLADIVNAEMLTDKLGDIGANMIVSTLYKLLEGNLERRKQPDEGATYAGKISNQELQIDWSKSAHEIWCKIRAFSPTPGAWCYINGQRTKILEAQVVPACSNGLAVKCGDGTLQIISLQPPGKKAMSASAFLNGHHKIEIC